MPTRRPRRASRASNRRPSGANHQWQSDTVARLFGTDGVRGRGRVSARSADRAAARRALVARAAATDGDGRSQLLIGRDTRESGGWIEAELAHGASGEGADGHERRRRADAGGRLSDAHRHGYDAGVVISASHNPFEDNGIKVFSGKGEKFTERVEREVEAIVADASWSARDRRAGDRCRARISSARISITCARCFPRHRALKPASGWRSTARTARRRRWRRQLFSSLGLDIVVDRQPARRPQHQPATADRRIPNCWRAPSSSAAARWAWRSTATATARSSSIIAAGSSTATPCC